MIIIMTNQNGLSGLTGEALGGALLFSYAGYLRTRDHAQSTLDRVEGEARMAFADSRAVNSGAFCKLMGFLAEHPEYISTDIDEVPVPEDITADFKNAALRTVTASTALNIARSAFPDFSREIRRWPRGRKISVKDIGKRNDTIRQLGRHGRDRSLVYAHKNQFQAVAGQLHEVNLLEDDGFIIVMTNQRKQVEVRPLIDRESGYLPNVQISFLD